MCNMSASMPRGTRDVVRANSCGKFACWQSHNTRNSQPGVGEHPAPQDDAAPRLQAADRQQSGRERLPPAPEGSNESDAYTPTARKTTIRILRQSVLAGNMAGASLSTGGVAAHKRECVRGIASVPVPLDRRQDPVLQRRRPPPTGPQQPPRLGSIHGAHID